MYTSLVNKEIVEHENDTRLFLTCQVLTLDQFKYFFFFSVRHFDKNDLTFFFLTDFNQI